MKERNLVYVLALLDSIETRDETSALIDRIEARHDSRCEEATSTSLHSKKKEARKIVPPQINSRGPSGLRKTTMGTNSLGHRKRRGRTDKNKG